MSLIDEIRINGLSDVQEILKSIGAEDLFEKAHKDGDMHPNGKWVWVSSAAGGKGDWRKLNGRTHKKHQTTTTAGDGAGSSKSSATQSTSTSTKTPSTKTNSSLSSSVSTSKKVVPDTYVIRGNRSSRKMDALYEEMDEKYKDLSREDLQKLKDKFDRKRTIELSIDRYKRLTKQGASKIAINKEGNLCDELTARYYTIKRLLDMQGAAAQQKKINDSSETYSHDINGVTVNVSKNKDGSYTLEANGKKVKSDDPSFFKDKLTPRVKKALAEELGIETTTKKTSTKSTSSSFKKPSKVFKKLSTTAKSLDELYWKILSYRGGRISSPTVKNGIIEGTLQSVKKRSGDKILLTVLTDDGVGWDINTTIKDSSKYQLPRPDESKMSDIKEGKEVRLASATRGEPDWSTLNYLINSGIEIQYQHGLSFRGSRGSRKINASEALKEMYGNTTFDAKVDGGILYINTYSGFDMD